MSITIAKAVGLNAKAVGGNLSNDVIKIQVVAEPLQGTRKVPRSRCRSRR